MRYLTRSQLDQRMTAIELYREGRTIHQVAHTMDVTPYSVDKWLTGFQIIRRCGNCEIILEANEYELCGVCNDVLKGGPWLGHMPLMESQEAITEINMKFA